VVNGTDDKDFADQYCFGVTRVNELTTGLLTRIDMVVVVNLSRTSPHNECGSDGPQEKCGQASDRTTLIKRKTHPNEPGRPSRNNNDYA
jgi:hypothetical protein